MNNNKPIISLLFSLLTIFSMPVYSKLVQDKAEHQSTGGTIKTAEVSDSKTQVELGIRAGTGGDICYTTDTNEIINNISIKLKNPDLIGTYSYDNSIYPIQNSGIPGIGVITDIKLVRKIFNNVIATPGPISDQPQNFTVSETGISYGDKKWIFIYLPEAVGIKAGSYNLLEYKEQLATEVTCTSSNNDTLNSIAYPASTLTITAPTCTIDDKMASNFPFGEIDIAEFQLLKPGENYSKSFTRKVTLDCPLNSWPAVKIRDQSDTANNTNTVFLTGAKDEKSGTAKGIGVQVFADLTNTGSETLQTLNTVINISQNRLKGQKTFSPTFTFKYVRTNEKLTAGEANAVVDLVFIYQ
ncbi:fimbrial protein [Orbus sturtevantii]|uniref:fimbrial protein n=1 Tax=Orbus sturtevantii TaxID=3074109 RepID=UPI00370DD05C